MPKLRSLFVSLGNAPKIYSQNDECSVEIEMCHCFSIYVFIFLISNIDLPDVLFRPLEYPLGKYCELQILGSFFFGKIYKGIT